MSTSLTPFYYSFTGSKQLGLHFSICASCKVTLLCVSPAFYACQACSLTVAGQKKERERWLTLFSLDGLDVNMHVSQITGFLLFFLKCCSYIISSVIIRLVSFICDALQCWNLSTHTTLTITCTATSKMKLWHSPMQNLRNRMSVFFLYFFSNSVILLCPHTESF